jgi:hypothetical protein
MIDNKSITILKELRDFIIPLSDESLEQLQKNILAEGCREPLIVWERNDSTLVLVDGHNRYKICEKHGLPYKIKKINFPDIDTAKLWMVDNQIGRRNLTADQASYYRGTKYLSLRQKKGGYKNVVSKGQIEPSTSEFLANQFNVSESTVKRDAKFAEGLNIIALSNPKLRAKILCGELKVSKTDIQTLPLAKHPEKISIKNEADLYNKAKRIREEILDQVENKLKKIETDKIEKSRQTLRELEPAFLNRNDRLKKLKGSIISAINKAINEKDTDAIKELKKLIDKLANEIFD